MKRRGSTLVEMMVVVTLMGLVLTISSALITGLFRMQRLLQADREQEQRLQRIDIRLRDDAHAARALNLPQTTVCELSQGKQTIRYEILPEEIRRERQLSGKIVHRDSFLLPPHCRADFSRVASSRQTLVKLTIVPGTQLRTPYAVPVRPAAIEAAINLPPDAELAEAVP